MVITLIGGGATSLAFLYNLLPQLPQHPGMPTTVYLVDKRGVFGPGAAYTADLASNLLNTKTGFITPFHDRPGDFYHWLGENQSVWRRSFPNFALESDGYAPRPLFGMYMQARMAWLVKQALARQVRIIQIDAEVTDVTAAGHGYVSRTDCSLNLASDHVVLCCGTLSARPDAALADNPRFLPNPYPIADLPHRIAPRASVAVVGARLSAIDSVIGLIENGHQGPVTLYSRSGYFPSVRGTQGRITPRVLNAAGVAAIVARKGRLHLEDIVQMVKQEIALSEGAHETLDALPPAPPADLTRFLEAELALAEGPRAWQAVLYSTNAIIDLLWESLDEADKQRFLSDYFSAFMSYRVSIPAENAHKMLSYLRSGQLRFQAGDLRVGADASGKPLLQLADGRAASHDYLIHATGSPRDVGALDSPLLANLLRRGTAQPHHLGGIVVDPRTYQVIGAGGGKGRLYALGELTTGNFFFTSALDINARHARQCATLFAASLTYSADAEATPVLRMHG